MSDFDRGYRAGVLGSVAVLVVSGCMGLVLSDKTSSTLLWAALGLAIGYGLVHLFNRLLDGWLTGEDE